MQILAGLVISFQWWTSQTALWLILHQSSHTGGDFFWLLLKWDHGEAAEEFVCGGSGGWYDSSALTSPLEDVSQALELRRASLESATGTVSKFCDWTETGSMCSWSAKLSIASEGGPPGVEFGAGVFSWITGAGDFALVEGVIQRIANFSSFHISENRAP